MHRWDVYNVISIIFIFMTDHHNNLMIGEKSDKRYISWNVCMRTPNSTWVATCITILFVYQFVYLMPTPFSYMWHIPMQRMFSKWQAHKFVQHSRWEDYDFFNSIKTDTTILWWTNSVNPYAVEIFFLLHFTHIRMAYKSDIFVWLIRAYERGRNC